MKSRKKKKNLMNSEIINIILTKKQPHGPPHVFFFFLNHQRYPRVRKATAEALYLRLVAVDRPEGRGMRDLEGALDVRCI